MPSEKLPLRRAATGDMVDPNIVPAADEIGNLVRLLVSQMDLIADMDRGERFTLSPDNRVPLFEVERSYSIHMTRYKVNGQAVGGIQAVKMVYLQMVFDALHIDSGIAPSLYQPNDFDNDNQGGTSYVQH